MSELKPKCEKGEDMNEESLINKHISKVVEVRLYEEWH